MLDLSGRNGLVRVAIVSVLIVIGIIAALASIHYGFGTTKIHV